MVDPEVVQRRLREIGRRLAALRALRRVPRSAFLADLALQAQTERHLQVALQAVIDVALHILAEDSDRTPEEYGAAFPALAAEEVIDADLASRLRLAAGLRNLLVHAYADVDPVRIWGHLEHLTDLEAFATAVQRYLERPDTGG